MFKKTLISAFILSLISVSFLEGTSNVEAAATVPRPDHVVIVVEENHGYSEVIGNSSAPYINSLAKQGALLTNSQAVQHPSQPNYLELFSGSNHGVNNDSCPHTFSSANLGSELIAKNFTFSGYSEDMPSNGYSGCNHLKYYRKHNPWVNFTNIPSSSNKSFTNFPSDYNKLPNLSFVIPNQNHDMHDGTIRQADIWLKQHLDGYIQWAKTHNSLLIVTWDEDDSSNGNRIPTLFIGPMVKSGKYSEKINHYNVLRTLEDMYGLPYAGKSSTSVPITDIWRNIKS